MSSMHGTAYEFDGLEEVEQRLARVISTEWPDAFAAMVVDVAVQLQGRVKARTPRRTSRLADGWRVGNLVRKGADWYIEVYNNVEYAECVEEGHRQQPGRYVPAIGKRLKARHVPGVHMMRISLAEVEARLPGYMRTWLNKFMVDHPIYGD